MSRSALPALPDYKLPHVLAAVGGTMTNHHDPKADAEACAEIALAIARLKDANTLEELGAGVGMRAGQLRDDSYSPCSCSSGNAACRRTR
jgi:hypothetical protein